MANIQKAKLTIKPIQPAETAECTVTGEVSFSGPEIDAIKKGYKFSLQCEIWAADKSVGEKVKGKDDILFTFPTVQIPAKPLAVSEPIKFSDKLALSKLDEDGVIQNNTQQDEIYAKLILTSKDFKDIKVNTPVVKQSF
jgi:hypothetical protein